MWVIDAGYLWFIWAIVFILSKWSQHLETALETRNVNDAAVNVWFIYSLMNNSKCAKYTVKILKQNTSNPIFGSLSSSTLEKTNPINQLGPNQSLNNDLWKVLRDDSDFWFSVNGSCCYFLLKQVIDSHQFKPTDVFTGNHIYNTNVE